MRSPVPWPVTVSFWPVTPNRASGQGKGEINQMGWLDKFRGPQPDYTLGRNDRCWCGSGKKYKHCHLQADQKKRAAAIEKSCHTGS